MTKKGKTKLSIQLPNQLLKAIDIIRTDLPRSDLINYFMTWYIEEHLHDGHLTDREAQRVSKLLIESRKVR